ncbi:MAG: CarD family transcriptional regulator, partial [Solirubrobacteraceae bacterium]
YYPSRGVNYESHLVPPPHLVGLRIAALDALLDASGPPAVVVVSAVALSEKVPDPSLRPTSFCLRVGDLVDLDETAMDLVAAGYERVDQVEDRGQFAVRGGLLDVFPATEDRAVRVDLFGDEIERLSWFSTFTQRSLGDAELVEVAPAAELAAEHRELAEIAALEDASERPDITELLPVEQFHPFLELVGEAASVMIAGDEDLAPALADHWQDVTAAFHDDDAHHLYVDPAAISAQLHERVRIRLSSIDSDQPFAFRAQAADVAARGLKEAEPELEKLARSGYRTVLTFARRGEGERFAYNLGRLRVRWLDGDDSQTDPAKLDDSGAAHLGEAGRRAGRSPEGSNQILLAQARLQAGFIAPQFHLAVIPDHRLFARRRAAERPGRERRRGVLRSFADLRTGDIVVHEDHGIARFAGFDTKTVAGVTRDYLYLEYAGSDRVFVPVDQLAKISRYVGGGGAHPPLSKLGGSRWDQIKSRA